MSCLRCTGFLVTEWCFDRYENDDAIDLIRCVNCGWRYDPKMVHNKQAPPKIYELRKGKQRRRVAQLPVLKEKEYA